MSCGLGAASGAGRLETFELQELHLIGNGQEHDLSHDWAILLVETSSNNQKYWYVRVDNTSQTFVPDGSSYAGTMLTTEGLLFTGMVCCQTGRITLDHDNAVLLQGTGPLHEHAPE